MRSKYIAFREKEKGGLEKEWKNMACEARKKKDIS